MGKMGVRGDWGEAGAMTGGGRKGQSEDFSPAFHPPSPAVLAEDTKRLGAVLRELSQPLPTNNTRNVVAAIQIQDLLLPNSKCPPRLPPTSASRSLRLSPPKPSTLTSKYTTTRPARQRPSLTTPLTKLLIPQRSPQTPTPSRQTVSSRRPSKATPSPST
jgi:hypothetical protein